MDNPVLCGFGMLSLRPATFTLTLVSLLATPAVAVAAPTRQACLSSYEESQVSMRRGRLMQARESLSACLDEACPPTLRADCADWLKEVETRTPSVVVEFVADGTSMRNVRLLVDGVVRPQGIDGHAMSLDPGNHTFRVEPLQASATWPPVVLETVIREGEKLRPVRIEHSSRQQPAGSTKAVPSPAPVAATRTEPKQEREAQRPIPWTVYAAGGMGLAAAAGFTVFAIAGSSGKSDLEPCKPDCSQAQLDSVHAKFVTADVFLGVSVVAIGAAVVLYLTRPSTTSAATALAPLQVRF